MSQRPSSRTITRSASRPANHPPPPIDLLGNPLIPPSSSMPGVFPTSDRSGILQTEPEGDDTARNISIEAVEEITRILGNPLNDVPVDQNLLGEEEELAAFRPTRTAPPEPPLTSRPIIQRFMSIEGIQQMVTTLADGLRSHRDYSVTEIQKISNSVQTLTADLQLQNRVLTGLRQTAGETKEFARIGQNSLGQGTNELLKLTAAFASFRDERSKRDSTETSLLQRTEKAVDKAIRAAETASQAQESALSEVNKILVSLNLKLGAIEEVVQAIDERQTATEPAAHPTTSSTSFSLPLPRDPSGMRRQSTPIPIRRSEQEGYHSDDSTTRRHSRTRLSATTRDRTLSSDSHIPKEARAKKPDPFNGKRGKDAESFMTRMNAFFLDFPPDAFDDQRKIRYVLLNMDSRDAENWAQPLLRKLVEEEEVEALTSWKNFHELFLQSFADLVKKEKAVKELNVLHQTKDVQSYATTFRILALEVDWNDNALIDKFRDGLKPEIKRELTRLAMFGDTKNFTLEEWVVLASKADEMVSPNQKKTDPAPHRPTRNAVPTDKTASRNSGTAGGSKPRVIVPEEEKLRRRKEGLCLKCGKANHVMKECRGSWTYEPQKSTQGKAATFQGQEDDDDADLKN